MAGNLEDRTLALAGIFQACYLVQQVATKGLTDNDMLLSSINTIFQQDPESVLAVYGSTAQINKGLRLIQAQLSNTEKPRNNELTKYAINVLFLSSKLLSDAKRLDSIAAGIGKARQQNTLYQHIAHENIIASLAASYSDNISTLLPRIMVAGDPKLLAISQNTQLIRALLLAAIRSGILWKQLGGSRWQILFQRKKLIKISRQLLNSAS